MEVAKGHKTAFRLIVTARDEWYPLCDAKQIHIINIIKTNLLY